MKPGIYTLKMAEYLALPYLSSGLCFTLHASSPAHARHELEHREQDANEASDTGTAIHDGLLEGIDRIVSIDAKDWRTNAAKEARAQAWTDGKIPLLAAKVENVQLAIAAAKLFVSQSEIAGVFDKGQAEQTIVFEAADGLLAKARPDWLNDEVCLHVKTTKGSAQPESWIRNQLTPCGYDMAAAFYARATDGAAQVFLVIEQQPPFGCSLVALSPAMMAIADDKVERAIRTWQACQKSGKWPMYPPNICYAEPKPWELAEAEERAATDQLSERELSNGIPL